MKTHVLGIIGIGALVAACTADPVATARHVGLAPVAAYGNCYGTDGEIYGATNGGSGARTVTLTPRVPGSQPGGASTSQTSSYNCTSEMGGEWNWYANAYCGVSEAHGPTPSGSETHCINPGRFDLSELGPVDWIGFPVAASGSGGLTVNVEKDGLHNSGVASNMATDVVVHSGFTYSATLTPKVHYQFVSDKESTTWVDSLFPHGALDTIRTDSANRWIRIGAWDALTNNDEHRLLMRYLWEGVDNDSASGFTNAYGAIGNLARVHQMPYGCGHITAVFQASNGLSDELNIPYRVGPGCYYTLTTSTSGSGSVARASGKNNSSTYLSGSVDTLTATPTSGWLFSGWSGACSNGSGPCIVTVTGATSVTANFTQQLTVGIHGSYNPQNGTLHSNQSICEWVAQPAGGTGTYTYYWHKLGIGHVLSDAANVELAIGTSGFTLVLEIDDGVNTASAQMVVNVSGSGTTYCF